MDDDSESSFPLLGTMEDELNLFMDNMLTNEDPTAQPNAQPNGGARREGPTANASTTAAPASTSMVDGIMGSKIAAQYPHKKHYFSHSNNIDPGDNSLFDDLTLTFLEENYRRDAINLPKPQSLLNSVLKYGRKKGLQFMIWQPSRIENPLETDKKKWIICGTHPPAANLKEENWEIALFREVRPSSRVFEKRLKRLQSNFLEKKLPECLQKFSKRPLQEYLDSRKPPPAALPTSPHSAAAMPQHNQDSPGSPRVAIVRGANPSVSSSSDTQVDNNGAKRGRASSASATFQGPVPPEIKKQLRNKAVDVITEAFDKDDGKAKRSSEYLNHPTLFGKLTVWEFAIDIYIAHSDDLQSEPYLKAKDIDLKRKDCLHNLIITPWRKWEQLHLQRCLEPLQIDHKIDPWKDWDDGAMPYEIFMNELVKYRDMKRWIRPLLTTALILEFVNCICNMRKDMNDPTPEKIGKPFWCELDHKAYLPDFQKYLKDRKDLDQEDGSTFNKRLYVLLHNNTTLNLNKEPYFKPFSKPVKRPQSADEVREIFSEYLADGTVKQLSETYVEKVCKHLAIPYQKPPMTE